MTKSQLDEAKRLAEESIEAFGGHGSIPISTYRLNAISKALLHQSEENERLKECLRETHKTMKTIQGRAGHPDAAQGCRNIIDTTKWWLEKYSGSVDYEA